MHKTLMETRDILERELESLNSTAEAGGMNPKVLCFMKDIVDAVKNINKSIAMEMESGEADMDNGYSEMRRPMMNRSYANRPKMGGLMDGGMPVRRNGYSYDDGKTDYIAEMERMLDKAPDAKTRAAVEQCIQLMR